MAAGAPLLLADCDYGPRELIVPGVSGTLVPVGDPLAMAAAIDRLIADPDQRRAHAEAARLRVRQFSIETIARRYAELIAAVALTQPEPAGTLRFASA